MLGCGASRRKLLGQPMDTEFHNLTTLDWNPAMGPDVVWDLEKLPWPFEDNSFDEVHAYHVIEHVTGRQGDIEPFFAFFTEVVRVLKPGGHLFAAVPRWDTEWAWGDPSHKRVFAPHTLGYLNQNEYKVQVGVTSMTDYRYCYKVNLEPEWTNIADDFKFVLRAVK